LVVGLGRNWV
jgi:hypothetical protein